MSPTQLRSDAVAQHQRQVVSLLLENGLPDEYNEKGGVFDQDSYRMALFKVRPLPLYMYLGHLYERCACGP
jgi:hypothetical protein